MIWVFLSGGYSHLETFDPKPALNKYQGMTFDKTPFENPIHSPLHKKRFRSVAAEEINIRDVYPTIYPIQVGWKQYGETGVEITDWWPHLAGCVDDLCFVRNMWTTDNDHAAENQIHTGRHRLDEPQPSIGSWSNYGLGSFNDNLPKFVVLGGPTRSDTRQSIDSYYLGPQYAGVPLALDPANPLPFGRRPAEQTAEEQQSRVRVDWQAERPGGGGVPGRPGTASPDSRRTNLPTACRRPFLRRSISPKKLPPRGNSTVWTTKLRSSPANACWPRGGWSNGECGSCRFSRRHTAFGIRISKLQENHARLCDTIDLPIAGLIRDLKQRGLLDEVVVVFCTEFGRTPGLELRGGGKDGRDHHPNGFTIWMAGAGLKRGCVHGATDELGYHALDDGHYVTDLHATVLNLLGLDNRRLEYPWPQTAGNRLRRADQGNLRLSRRSLASTVARRPRLRGSQPLLLRGQSRGSLYDCRRLAVPRRKRR